MRIVFAGGGTGGHLYPGIAIARELVRLDSRVKPFFVGALRGVEKDVLPTTEFPHLLLDLHPLYRPAVWNNWKTVRGAFTSWRKISRMVAQERPDLVVGTGGYAAALMLAYAVDQLPGECLHLVAPLGMAPEQRLVAAGHVALVEGLQSQLPSLASRAHPASQNFWMTRRTCTISRAVTAAS